MELFKSLKTRTKSYEMPFKHYEINQPLTDEAINEICKADIADPRKENLNYDGTRALDGGEGAFRAGIKDGGKAKKIRCYVTDDQTLFNNIASRFCMKKPEKEVQIDL